MWCVVKVNQVIQLIPHAKNVLINDVQHPAAIFRSWTPTELANIGVFPLSEQSKDEKHHKYRGERYDIQADRVVKVWDKVTDLPLADVKAGYVTQTQTSALSQLKPTDWYALRKAETGDAIPSDVATYRAAVRSAEDTITKAIKAKKSVKTIKAMLVVPDGGKAPMHDWPDPLE